ncbi:MAG: hypothetical protein U1F67_07690 [Rubrivivax sp.]
MNGGAPAQPSVRSSAASRAFNAHVEQAEQRVEQVVVAHALAPGAARQAGGVEVTRTGEADENP